jgi:hypothetical protein
MYGAHWGQETDRAGALREAIGLALDQGCEVHLESLRLHFGTDSVEFLRVFLPDQREFLATEES